MNMIRYMKVDVKEVATTSGIPPFINRRKRGIELKDDMIEKV